MTTPTPIAHAQRDYWPRISRQRRTALMATTYWRAIAGWVAGIAQAVAA